MKPVRVLIVDDSPVVRQVLNELLSHGDGIEVVGTAVDPYDAREKIKQLNPDVLTLDVEMPRMDGVTFLRNLMKLRPMPVIMISSLTMDGADVTLEALELGAIDYIPKPTVDVDEKVLEQFRQSLYDKVKAAAGAGSKLKFRRNSAAVVTEEKPDANPVSFDGFSLVAIGASTGGTEAVREVLRAMPEKMPPVVVTQHIPENFSERFAKRLDECTRLTVVHAEDGQRLLPGHVYVAPGNRHLTVKKHGYQMICQLDDRGAVNRHCPSVEVMFNSILEIEPQNSVAVMLTGMGEDGALAMKNLREAGTLTIAQDEATSLVWGMPGAAVRHNAAEKVLALGKIAQAVTNKYRK